MSVQNRPLLAPVSLRSSNGIRMCVCVCECESVCVCVCVCVCVDGMNFKYALRWHIHMLVHSVLYASIIHKHTHTRILKLFEDSEPTGLKVDIANNYTTTSSDLGSV